MRCKRPPRWSEDHPFPSRNALKALDLAAHSEPSFPAEKGEEVLPFSDVPGTAATAGTPIPTHHRRRRRHFKESES
jgi:hypothetical protein